MSSSKCVESIIPHIEYGARTSLNVHVFTGRLRERIEDGEAEAITYALHVHGPYICQTNALIGKVLSKEPLDVFARVTPAPCTTLTDPTMHTYIRTLLCTMPSS